MKIKNASAGALTNFELFYFFQSRGPSEEVPATIAPSEHKVFEYLIGTSASHQTEESISVLMDRVKKYDLAKSEVLDITNLKPTLLVGVYTIVENCDVRLGGGTCGHGGRRIATARESRRGGSRKCFR